MRFARLGPVFWSILGITYAWKMIIDKIKKENDQKPIRMLCPRQSLHGFSGTYTLPRAQELDAEEQSNKNHG